MARLMAASIILVALAACSGGTTDPPSSLFWDTTEDVEGGEALTLGGEGRDFPDLVWLSDAAVVVEIVGVESTILPPAMSEDIYIEDPEQRELIEQVDKIRSRTPLATTYAANVSSWLLGNGGSRISITQAGGVGPEATQSFRDGTFLLEPGRKYLLLLTSEDGDYWYHSARTGFDLTDGVKVLNHESTRDLEDFEEMSIDEFVDSVSGIAVSEPDKDFCELASGDEVRHREFGEGFVLDCRGSDSTFEASVAFDGDVGVKVVPLDELSVVAAEE